MADVEVVANAVSEADVTIDEVGCIVVASEEVVEVENPPKEKLADGVEKSDFEVPNSENKGCCWVVTAAAAAVVEMVFTKDEANEETSGTGTLVGILLSSLSNFSGS